MVRAIRIQFQPTAHLNRHENENVNSHRKRPWPEGFLQRDRLSCSRKNILSKLYRQAQRDGHCPRLLRPRHFHRVPLQEPKNFIFIKAPGLPTVNIVCANIHTDYHVSINVKDRPQIALDPHRMNVFAVNSGKPVNFMGTQSGIKRVFFEYFEGHLGRKFLRRLEFCQRFSKRRRRFENVTHGRSSSCKALSRSISIPCSASAMP